MLKNRIVALILVLVSALFLTGTAAAQESVYKFTLAWGVRGISRKGALISEISLMIRIGGMSLNKSGQRP